MAKNIILRTINNLPDTFMIVEQFASLDVDGEIVRLYRRASADPSVLTSKETVSIPLKREGLKSSNNF